MSSIFSRNRSSSSAAASASTNNNSNAAAATSNNGNGNNNSQQPQNAAAAIVAAVTAASAGALISGGAAAGDDAQQLTLLGRTLGPDTVQHFSTNNYFCGSRTTALKILRDILACVHEFKMLQRVTTWGETSQKKLCIFGILPITFGGAKPQQQPQPQQQQPNSSSGDAATNGSNNVNNNNSFSSSSAASSAGSAAASAAVAASAAALVPGSPRHVVNTHVQSLSASAAASILAAPTSLQLGVPIQVWLSVNYPVEPPQCYVVPSSDANEKLVSNHPIVDRSGMCYAPLLASWNPNESTLVPLLKQFQRIFGVIPPLWIDDRPLEGSNNNGASPDREASNASFGAGGGNNDSFSGSPSGAAGGGGDESNLCVVCLCEEKDTVLVPCGHFNLCSSCASSLQVCPMCRSPIRLRQRVFS